MNNVNLNESMSFGFRIAVFDLDDTLWNGVKLFTDSKQILTALKAHGVKLYLASFHTDAKNCCRLLDIEHFFTDILYGIKKTKSEMIKYIINKNPNVLENEIAFFDDNMDNIRNVQMNTGVKTVYVSDGIKWEHIIDVIDRQIVSMELDNMEDIKDDFHISDKARFAKASMKIIY